VLKVCRTPGPTACLKMLSKVCLKSCSETLGTIQLKIGMWKDDVASISTAKWFGFVSVKELHVYVKIALFFFLLAHGCGATATWAARNTILCLDLSRQCVYFLHSWVSDISDMVTGFPLTVRNEKKSHPQILYACSIITSQVAIRFFCRLQHVQPIELFRCVSYFTSLRNLVDSPTRSPSSFGEGPDLSRIRTRVFWLYCYYFFRFFRGNIPKIWELQ